MSFPVFSILKEFKDAVINHNSYNAKIDELTAELTAIQAAIAGQNLTATNTNNISVSGGGASLWQGSLLASETAIIADGLEFAQISSYIVKSGSGAYGFGEGGVGLNQSFQIDNVGIGMNSSGQLWVTAPGSNSFEVTVAFTSVPLIGGGIVGPRGATGSTGQTGEPGADGDPVETAWTSLYLGTGWTNLNTGIYGAAGYRKFGTNVQLRGVVTCANWTTNPLIFTLPDDGFRPPYKLFHDIFIGSGATTARLDINTSGNGSIYSITENDQWVSLAPVFFSTI